MEFNSKVLAAVQPQGHLFQSHNLRFLEPLFQSHKLLFPALFQSLLQQLHLVKLDSLNKKLTQCWILTTPIVLDFVHLLSDGTPQLPKLHTTTPPNVTMVTIPTLIANAKEMDAVKTLPLELQMHNTLNGLLRIKIGVVLLVLIHQDANLVQFVDIGLKSYGKIQLILDVPKFVAIRIRLSVDLLGPTLSVTTLALETGVEIPLLHPVQVPVLKFPELPLQLKTLFPFPANLFLFPNLSPLLDRSQDRPSRLLKDPFQGPPSQPLRDDQYQDPLSQPLKDPFQDLQFQLLKDPCQDHPSQPLRDGPPVQLRAPVSHLILNPNPEDVLIPQSLETLTLVPNRNHGATVTLTGWQAVVKTLVIDAQPAAWIF